MKNLNSVSASQKRAETAFLQAQTTLELVFKKCSFYRELDLQVIVDRYKELIVYCKALIAYRTALVNKSSDVQRLCNSFNYAHELLDLYGFCWSAENFVKANTEIVLDFCRKKENCENVRNTDKAA